MLFQESQTLIANIKDIGDACHRLANSKSISDLLLLFANYALKTGRYHGSVLYTLDPGLVHYRPLIVTGNYKNSPIFTAIDVEQFFAAVNVQVCVPLTREALSRCTLPRIKKYVEFLNAPVFAPIFFENRMEVFLLLDAADQEYSAGSLDELGVLTQMTEDILALRKQNEQFQSQINRNGDYFVERLTQDLVKDEKKIVLGMMENVSQGIIGIDNDGIIYYINQEAEKITGWTRHQALDSYYHDVLQLLDASTHECVAFSISGLYQFESALRNELQYKFPLLVARDGLHKTISFSIQPVYQENEPVAIGHVVSILDISEYKEIQDQSLLNQRMSAIGQLAAGIAHEINTPIQYVGDNLRYLQVAIQRIQGYQERYRKLALAAGKYKRFAEPLRLVEDDYQRNRVEQFLSEIPSALGDSLDGIERVRKIVLAIREFSHPTQNEFRPADINHGIETTTTISRNEWKYVADLELNLDPDLPMIYCHVDEINQVVLNMIVNSAQAIGEKIRDKTMDKGLIQISTRSDRDRALIEIKDTGCGMTKEIMENIFNPFFTTKEVGVGTGQGLFLAHNVIVNKHHGAIHVTSQPGQGTTFTIDLPIHKQEETNG